MGQRHVERPLTCRNDDQLCSRLTFWVLCFWNPHIHESSPTRNLPQGFPQERKEWSQMFAHPYPIWSDHKDLHSTNSRNSNEACSFTYYCKYAWSVKQKGELPLPSHTHEGRKPMATQRLGIHSQTQMADHSLTHLKAPLRGFSSVPRG